MSTTDFEGFSIRWLYRSDEVDQYAIYEKEEIDEVIAETVKLAVQEVVSHLESSLSQSLDERLTGLDVRHAEAMARFKAEQTTAISKTRETIMTTLEIALRKYMHETTPSNVRSITEAASRKTSNKGGREIDTIIWSLLNSGMTVRAIADKADTSTATVGRSRKRWDNAGRPALETDRETAEEAL